jgi:hypothetical protein
MRLRKAEVHGILDANSGPVLAPRAIADREDIELRERHIARLKAPAGA